MANLTVSSTMPVTTQDRTGNWRTSPNHYASPARVYSDPGDNYVGQYAQEEDDGQSLDDEGLPNDLYPTSSHLQWEEYFRDAASQGSGDIDNDLSSSEDEIVDILFPILQQKHELSAYAKPYIPVDLPARPRWSPFRFAGPLFGLLRLEDIYFRQISNPSRSIFMPVSSPLDHQELVFCPELLCFLDDLLTVTELPLAPSPLPIIHSSRYAFGGTHQRNYLQPPPPPPNHPLAAPASDLALDSESDFPSLVANPRNPGVKSSRLSAVSASPPPPTCVNPPSVLPASLARPVPLAAAVQPQVPAVVRMPQAANETALFTFMQLPKKSHHCTYNINGIVLSVRNIIKKRLELNHLSKSDFDSETCRCFMGLNEAAGLAVMKGVPHMEFPPMGYMKEALNASLKRVIDSITNV